MIKHSHVPFWSKRYLLSGQILLGLSLFCCLVVIPHYFFSLDQGGVSNYGTETRTVTMFTIGFGAATLGTFLAAITLPRGILHRTQVRIGLSVLAGLYLLVMLSTFSYKVSDSLKGLHEHAAIALFTVMLLETLWLRYVLPKDREVKRAFMVFYVSFAAGVLTLIGFVHILFLVQVVCGASFGYLLVRGVSVLKPALVSK